MKAQVTTLQLEEFRAALREQRQPNCVTCGEPLEVIEHQDTYITWSWSTEGKRYYRQDLGNTDGKQCGNCEVYIDDAIWVELIDGEDNYHGSSITNEAEVLGLGY